MQVLNYRKDIDGLRAISVISVVIYHLNLSINDFKVFAGGFLGVDIFFVISGFLITKILIKEIKEKKNINIVDFYIRRMRRIFPVLLIVIFFFLIINFSNQFYRHFQEYLDTSVWSIFFVSSIYFVLNDLFYGSLVSSLKPLLHTWSLSLEEQFYIFYPLILLVIYKFLNKKFIFFTIIGISFSLCLLIIYKKNTILTFYLIPFRAWEILLGALMVYLNPNKINVYIKFNNNFLLLIILSFLFFFDREEYLHPSLITLIPIICTCLILLNNNQSSLSNFFLTNKISVFIGLISYSIYMWHYPIIALMNYKIFGEPHILIKLSLFGLIFVISIISYYFIEKPFRNKKKIKTKNFLYIIFFSILLILILSTQLLKIKKPLLYNYKITGIRVDNTVLSLETEKFRKNYNLNFDYNVKNKKILIIGDSHGDDLFRIFFMSKQNYPEIDFSLMMGDVFCFYQFLNKNFEACNKVYLKQKKLNFLLKDLEFAEYILISTDWDDRDLKILPQLIELLKKNGKKIIISSNTPEFKTNLAYGNSTILDKFLIENKINLITQKKLSQSQINKIEKLFFENLNTKVFLINNQLKVVANKYHLIYLDKFDYICNFDLKICKFLTDDNKKLFYDYGHYTIDGSLYLKDIIFEKNWLKLK
jgi:peptidoglycan/LPS O-acetylase OafA/YrhL